jgi:hypothetical protein
MGLRCHVEGASILFGKSARDGSVSCRTCFDLQRVAAQYLGERSAETISNSQDETGAVSRTRCVDTVGSYDVGASGSRRRGLDDYTG